MKSAVAAATEGAATEGAATDALALVLLTLGKDGREPAVTS